MVFTDDPNFLDFPIEDEDAEDALPPPSDDVLQSLRNSRNTDIDAELERRQNLLATRYAIELGDTEMATQLRDALKIKIALDFLATVAGETYTDESFILETEAEEQRSIIAAFTQPDELTEYDARTSWVSVQVQLE